jgi:hypothetical protein
MIDLLVPGIVFSIAIFLFAVAIGSNLFAVMIDDRVQHLRLIIACAPLPASVTGRSCPEPVSRYLALSARDTTDGAGCARLRFSGRTRFGRTGRWMKMGGTAFFSLAVPGFVWHTTISRIPGMWMDMCEYYLHKKGGMTLNLFSFLPLARRHDCDTARSSLFRYLAMTPFFPKALAHPGWISWHHTDDSAAVAEIRHDDISVQAITRFDQGGRIESITLHDTESAGHLHTATRVFSCHFSGYTDAGGYRIPGQCVTEHILPGGEYTCTEFFVTSVEYDIPKTVSRESA